MEPSPFIKCSKCNDAEFQEWQFEGQKFAFKSCRSCRDKAKAIRDAGGFANGPQTTDLAPVLDAMRKLYVRIDEVEENILRTLKDMNRL